jgi:DNA repair protein SbcC/Rad50
MKILRIEIENLASLSGNHVIDFQSEPLSSAGVFAITGPTGSGKSTILDAVCLSLFGKTPRFEKAGENGVEITDVGESKIKQGDVRTILSDGTAKGFAAVDFLGVDGQVHRATWSVRRAREKVNGTLQADEQGLMLLVTKQPFPGKKKETREEIERLVGLNFDQFTRSVLLAQGDFSAFLKANKDEKAGLLERLTGTEIYSEISKTVFRRHKEEEKILLEFAARKGAVQVMEEAERKELEHQINDLNENGQVVVKQLEEYDKLKLWYLEYHKLLARIKNAQTQLETYQNTWDTLSNERNELAILKAFEQVNAQIWQWKKGGERHSELVKEREGYERSLKDKRKVQEDIEKGILEVSNALEMAALACEAWKEKWSLGEQQLRSLTDLDKRILDLDTGLSKINEEIKNQEIELNKWLSEEQTVKEGIVRLSSWKKENIWVEKCANDLKFLEGQMLDFQTLDKQIADKKQRLHIDGESLNAVLKSRNDCTVLRQNYTTEKEVLLGVIEKLESEKPAQSFEELGVLKTKVNDDLVCLRAEGEELLKEKSMVEAMNSKEQLLSHLKLEINELTEQLNREVGREESLRKSLEVAQLNFERMRLQAEKSVADLRQNLVDEVPCPVCGSVHHPYKLSAPVVTFLNELEKEVKDIKQEHHAVLSEMSKKNGMLQIIQQQEGEESTKLKELNEVLTAWCMERNKDLAEVRSIHWEKVLSDFDGRLNATQIRVQELEEAQKFAFQWQQAAQEHKVHFERLKSKIDDLNKSIQSFDNEEIVLNDKIKLCASEIQELADKLSGMAEILGTYFQSTPLSDWILSIPENIKELIEWTNRWSMNGIELKKLEEKLSSFVAPISTANKSLGDLNSRKEEGQQSLNHLMHEKESISALYQAVFPEESPSEHRERLRNSIEQKNVLLQKQNLLLVELKTEVNSLIVQLARNQENTQTLQVEQDAVKTQLDEWIVVQNQAFGWDLNWSYLLEKSENLTLRKQELEHLITSTKNNLEVAEKLKSKELEQLALHEVNRPEVLEEEVLTHIEMLKSKWDDLLQIRSGLEAKLKHDDAQRLSIESLLEAYQAQLNIFHQWSKLNELIGSLEGHKFRQIVQELTLDYLLVFANEQLKALTTRYKVQRIPNSLGLQVVDGDMGEEVRTVFSLSGGETFLVSLALALGLSELTGSMRHAESLFIDEGFGALDPATLAVAMDALDRLQYQGRKVGVISHVQEMNERIPVRIEVLKRAGGKSEISVRG